MLLTKEISKKRGRVQKLYLMDSSREPDCNQILAVSDGGR
jgi:hypothetical protein